METHRRIPPRVPRGWNHWRVRGGGICPASFFGIASSRADRRANEGQTPRRTQSHPGTSREGLAHYRQRSLPIKGYTARDRPTRPSGHGRGAPADGSQSHRRAASKTSANRRAAPTVAASLLSRTADRNTGGDAIAVVCTVLNAVLCGAFAQVR